MQKQKNIQQALKKAFPEFGDKKLLIDYYVSFDFPDKQMRMVGWWQRVIQFIIQQENRAYVTYQELVSFLTIQHLKPTPLQSIIKHLAKKDAIVPQNQYEIKEAKKQNNIENKKSLFDSLLSYVYKPALKEQSPFKFIPTQKIYSKKIKEFKKNHIKKILPNIFTQHVKSINFYKLVQQLQEQVHLDRDSLFQLLDELDKDHIISLSQNTQQVYVLYSNNSVDFENREWVELESMKFCLRQQIETFQFKTSQQEEKVSKLREKAKQQIGNKQTKAAHATCREIAQKQKKIANINTRKNILQNQITQLEYNEMNKNTITLLEQAHAVYEQTMIDQNKLDQIVQKNMEIEVANKHVNQKIESLASREDIDDQVDEMMRSLEKEIMKQPQKQKIKVEIPMEIQPIKKRQPQKQNIKVEIPMDIEDKTKQQPKQKMDIEGYKA